MFAEHLAVDLGSGIVLSERKDTATVLGLLAFVQRQTDGSYPGCCTLLACQQFRRTWSMGPMRV